jgi:hypothetical protein
MRRFHPLLPCSRNCVARQSRVQFMRVAGHPAFGIGGSDWLAVDSDIEKHAHIVTSLWLTAKL